MSDKKAVPKPESGFLFVNKNAQSKSFSRAGTREEAAAINSYAQKWYLENNSKKGAGKPLLPFTTIPTRIKPLTAYVSKVRISQLTDDGTKPKRRRRKPRKKTDEAVGEEILYDPLRQSSLPKTTPVCSLPTPSDTEKSSSQSPPLMVVNHIPGSSTDPFAQSSLPMTGEVLPVLQYYINFTLLATFNANVTTSLSPAQLAHSSAIESIITGCLSNKSHMYALLSATSSRMRRVSNVPLAPACSPEFFLNRAIGSIRDNLATQALSDQQTMLDIFYLSVCEWYMKSYDAARTHFSFLRHFWKDLDPRRSALEKYIHDMVSYNDIFLAVETGETPFLGMEWDPAPLSEERMNRVRNVILPSSLQLPPYQGSPPLRDLPAIYGSGFCFMEQQSDMISDDLRQIFWSIPELMQVYHFTLQATSDSEEESSYLSKKSQSLLHRLTSFPAYGYELCMSISLTILLSCMSTSAAWRAGKVDMVRLAKRLSRQLEYEIQVDLLDKRHLDHKHLLWTGKDNRMLLWILLTGLFAAGASPEASWFGLRAVSVTLFLGLDRSETQSLLHSFLYLPPLQAAGVEYWYQNSFG